MPRLLIRAKTRLVLDDQERLPHLKTSLSPGLLVQEFQTLNNKQLRCDRAQQYFKKQDRETTQVARR